jgi:predicted DNA-binding transcriptional regulator AlpA
MSATAPEGLDAKALAAFLSVGVSTVYELDGKGLIPSPVTLGDGRCRRWIRSEIVAWLQAGAPGRARWEFLKGNARSA